MRYKLILAILLLSASTMAQKTFKTKKHSLSSSHKEVFQVDKKSKDRHGFYYVINTNSKDTLVTGHYINNKPTGVWHYYDKNATLLFEYDYSNFGLKSIQTGIGYDSTYIISNGNFQFDKVDNPQLYLGYKNEAITELAMKLKLPIEVIKAQKSGMCIYSFVIDENGQLGNIQTAQSLSIEFDNQVIEALSNLRKQWHPAHKNQTAIASQTALVIEFGSNLNTQPDYPLLPYEWHLQINYNIVTKAKVVTRTTKVY